MDFIVKITKNSIQQILNILYILKSLIRTKSNVLKFYIKFCS